MNTSYVRTTSALGLLALFALGLVLPAEAGAQSRPKPDFRVTAINTPGGLCKGTDNKVQATIQNSSQLAGYNGPIPVWLSVKQLPTGSSSIYEASISGIGPNGSQPAWFHNVNLPANGNFELKVTADPGNNILEATEANNTLTVIRSVTKTCGQVTPAPATYALTIRVFEHGTWSGGQGQWITGASVTLTKKYDSSYGPLSGTTNSQGQVTFNVPSGALYEFSVNKSGCGQVASSPSQAGSTGTYQMSTYAATRYLALNCN
jgi:hypothetical protein